MPMVQILSAKLQALVQSNPVSHDHGWCHLSPHARQAQKKKYDDVAKKIEALYQKFREYTVCAVLCVLLCKCGVSVPIEHTDPDV